jgi:hypothetical protein
MTRGDIDWTEFIEAGIKAHPTPPCSICGSTRSDRGYVFGGPDVHCFANANGRDRCQERWRALPGQPWNRDNRGG